jgi:hypothetical protein
MVVGGGVGLDPDPPHPATKLATAMAATQYIRLERAILSGVLGERSKSKDEVEGSAACDVSSTS